RIADTFRKIIFSIHRERRYIRIPGYQFSNCHISDQYPLGRLLIILGDDNLVACRITLLYFNR
ncbi:MAG: hypothetical protein ABW140_13085, partial [Candidatus Sedimenticola sp. 6PFRAG1]